MISETSEKDQGEQYLEASYITFDFISGFFLWLWSIQFLSTGNRTVI